MHFTVSSTPRPQTAQQYYANYISVHCFKVFFLGGGEWILKLTWFFRDGEKRKREKYSQRPLETQIKTGHAMC